MNAPLLSFLFALSATSVLAQAPPRLSPQAAYDQAVKPIETVHRSVANWSDAELASLAVAIGRAAEACGERKPLDHAGEDLVALARLCSLGQQWQQTQAAAARYIDLPTTPKPQLAAAYGLDLIATLHSNDLAAILKVSQAMLAAVPYDPVVDASANDALSYLEVAYSSVARELHRSRQPILLAALGSEHPALPRHLLYADGLAMAALEQYMGEPGDAARTVTALDEALTRWPLTPDDALPVAEARRRYALLGSPLPKIVFTRSLLDPRDTPHINPDYGGATALLLFPDWCAQCVRMGPELGVALGRLGQTNTRVYALLAESPPGPALLLPAPARIPTRALPSRPQPESPKPRPRTSAELMLHTPTLVVPPETLATFAASDFPFLIVVDHAGIVRFAEVAPEAALAPGGFLDSVVEDVATRWPTKKSSARKPPAP